MTFAMFELAAAGCAGGLIVGMLYFTALKLSVTQFMARGGWKIALLLSLLRIGGAVGAFILLAQLGIFALIGAGAGFLAARMLALKLAEGTS
jgi:F1F0 ATPase subunit 2